MLSSNVLDGVLGTPGQVRVLRVLTLESGREHCVRELARRARVSSPQAEVALRRFENVGLAVWRVEGRSHLWRLNSAHVLVPSVERLFGDERGSVESLLQEIRTALRRPGVVRASVFGSVARGDAGPNSDLDLYVEVDDPGTAERVRSVLLDLRLDWQAKFDTMVSPLIWTEAEAKDPPNPALAANIRRDSLSLLGDE